MVNQENIKGTCRPIGRSSESLSVEEDGLNDYLPQSAALLVTALQRSGLMRKLFEKSGCDLSYHDDTADEEAAISVAGTSQEMTKMAFESRSSPPFPITLTTPQMEINERVADMLFDSIIRMDDNLSGGGIRGSTRKKAEHVERKAMRGGLGVAEGSDVVAVAYDADDSGVIEKMGSMVAMASGATSTSYGDYDHDDDDDSIGGDMSLLVSSIASLQRDLENADVSHLDLGDNFYDDDEACGGAVIDDYTSLLSRLKRWISRVMAMEKTLLHTYSSNNLIIANYYDDGVTDAGITIPNGMDGYADKQILAWSLALMWAFIVQILNTSKNCTIGRGTQQIRRKWFVGTAC